MIPQRVARLAKRGPLTPDERRQLIVNCLATVEANVTIVPEAGYLPLEGEARWRIARDERD